MGSSNFEIYRDEVNLFNDSDCDCACPSSVAPSRLPHNITTPLERHPAVQLLPLVDSYVVAFVPSASRVVVLNSAAQSLLDQFATPTHLGALPTQASAAAQELYQAGLLQPTGTTPLPPLPADELVAWLHVTNACNLRCTYCYVDKTDEAMSAETAFAAIDAVMRSAQQHGYRKVKLKYAGGEASLNLSLVEQMHRYAQRAAACVGGTLHGVVLSNGVGLTKIKLAQIRDLGVRLMISLDGTEAIHDAQRPRIGGQGSYTAAVASIERARALGVDLTVSVTVTGASAGGVRDVVTWLLEHEVRFSLNFYRECDNSQSIVALRTDEQQLIAGMRAAYTAIEHRLPAYSVLGSLLDRTNLGAAHQRTCAAGENYLVVDHHGQIAKCQMEIAQPVTSVWADNPLGIIRLDQRGVQNISVDEKEGCRSCEWKYWCTGGCAVATFRATGRYDVQSPNCGVYKALYPDVIRLEGLRLLARGKGTLNHRATE